MPSFEDLAFLLFAVAEQHVGVVRGVFLPFGRVDRDLLHHGLKAKGAAFVGDDRHNQLADGRILEQPAHDADKTCGGGKGTALGTGEVLLEEVQRWGLEGGFRNTASGQVAAQRFSTGLHVGDGWIAGFGPIEGGFPGRGLGKRDIELRDKGGKAFVGELLLGVGGVTCLRSGETVALDGFGENDRRTTLVLQGALVGVVDLERIVAAAVEAGELLIGPVFDELEQFRVLAEEFLAQVGATLGLVGLEVPVDTLLHALQQQALVIALKELVPIRAPDDLDHVPGGAAEHAFKLVDDALVAAHGAVQSLKIAVDNKNEVVETFTGGQRDRTEGVNLVGFSVPHKGPDLAVRMWDEAAVLQILHEAGLVDCVQGADAHGDRRKLPEILHEPRVRVAGQAGFTAELVAEVL